MRIPNQLFKVPGLRSLAKPQYFSLALLPSLRNGDIVCYLSTKRQQYWQRSPVSSLLQLWFILNQEPWLVYKSSADFTAGGNTDPLGEVQIYPKKLSQLVHLTWVKALIPTGQPITSLPIMSRALGWQNPQGQNQSWEWPVIIPFRLAETFTEYPVRT